MMRYLISAEVCLANLGTNSEHLAYDFSCQQVLQNEETGTDLPVIIR